jgi:ribosomal protein S18 acetylase RimI-like enzyme
MRLRAATIADAPVIGRLHADSWRYAYRGALSDEYLDTKVDREQHELWQGRLESPPSNQSVFVLVDNLDILGFACIYVNHHPAFGSFLNNLHVVQSQHRHGYGTRLMAAVREHCLRLSPASALYLFVLESNERAQSFYYRLGATHRGDEIWHPPGGGEALVYQLSWRTPKEVRLDA